jgi:predicted Zn-ribbon and HTH transcriptional regulator
MKILLDDLPLDASDKRRAKIFLLAHHVYNQPDGITHEKLLLYGRARFSNIVKTLNEYILESVQIELTTKIGNKYYVLDDNLQKWGEAHGFVEVYEPVKCLGCEYEYFTSLTKCPKCGSVERESVSTDDVSTIYTHSRSETEIDTRKDVNQPIHTNIPEKANSRQKTGKQGELKAIEVLNQYGEASQGKGTYGEPDVYWISSNHSYGIEVKSVGHNKRNKSFKLDRKAWDRLCGYCDHNELIPAIFVEERINGSPMGDNYHLILRNRVDEKLDDSDADRVSISIYELSTLHYQAFSLGRKIELREGI